MIYLLSSTVEVWISLCSCQPHKASSFNFNSKKISLYLNEKIELTVSKQRCVCAKVGMLEVFGETYQKHLETCINLDISSPTHLG